MQEKKPYYSIGQVAEYFELPQSVLRYWESVFDALNPQKSPGGSRRYSDEDLKIIAEIKHLLYKKGFTIKGANKLLNQKYKIQSKPQKPQQSVEISKDRQQATTVDQKLLKKIIHELKAILKEMED